VAHPAGILANRTEERMSEDSALNRISKPLSPYRDSRGHENGLKCSSPGSTNPVTISSRDFDDIYKRDSTRMTRKHATLTTRSSTS
jgi:hypothetical protein